MSAPIRSMTGFARVQRTTPHGEISVSLKSVNHKGLDPHFHLEADLEAFEGALRAALKKAILRGHVDVRCAVVRSGDAVAGGLNAPLLRACLAAFRKTAREEGLDNAQPDLNQLMRLPGMFGADVEPAPDPIMERPLLAVFEEALEVLNQFRSREGAELAALIRDHNRAIASGARRDGGNPLPRHTGFPEAPGRENRGTARRTPLSIRNESRRRPLFWPIAAISAKRFRASRSTPGNWTRFSTAGGEVGKKLDFLLQEMNRETNTVLSKTNGIGELGLRITDLALAAKAGIEKIREQALNLE